MSPSPSPPPQTPVTILDELHTRSVASPVYICQNNFAEATRSHPDSLPSTIPRPASPTPPSPFSHHATYTPMSAIQSKVQPNPSSQNVPTTSISINGNTSCLTRPGPAAPVQRGQTGKLSSQSLDSGIAGSISLSTQSITPSFSFPVASNSATTYKRFFQDSTYSQCTLPTASPTESISSTSQRTPNVYINGLRPHCSEQDLFALARPFGDIKSVRTFTRHVSEKPTGYGFVLFSDVASAQRCIEGLRKCRNLHPSFSKQVHRIPGTEYAQHNAAQTTDEDENSFKARMEKLKDSSSTNLYIEGLPLSIDDESLAALMLPYKIKSSRFFKTKLSNPPRIIAFVRLETRTSAEETIERLHGRMVRGWDDPGCRISVRFADSAEQRELRRTERTLKNGDHSPSRLTIAQAALLNLRGQELQTNIRNIPGGKSQRLTNPRSENQISFNPGSDPAFFPASRSLPSKLCYTYRESPLPSASDLPAASEMDNLLQSIHNMGYDDGALESTIKGLALDNEYLMTQQPQLRAFAGATIMSPSPIPVTLPRGHTQAHNGFTPAEELILEAHAQHLQVQTQTSKSTPAFESICTLRNFNTSIHDLKPEFCEVQAGRSGKAAFAQENLPSISEDDFHAMGHRPLRNFMPGTDSHPPTIPSTTSTVFVPPPSRAVSIVPPPPDYEESGKRSKGPHHRRGERMATPKQIPCPSSLNSCQPIPSSETKSNSLPQASTRPNNICDGNDSNYNTGITSREKHQQTYIYSQGDVQSRSEEDRNTHFRSSPAPHIYAKKSPQLNEQHPTVKEGPKSPAIVSPALTYSSRTPSTLSPATPFFGSFTSSQYVFEVMMMENEDVAEKKMKVGK